MFFTENSGFKNLNGVILRHRLKFNTKTICMVNEFAKALINQKIMILFTPTCQSISIKG